MISKIRNNRSFKGISVMLALSIFVELVAPTMSFALTGGPAQPEFSSFTPIGTSDMVDLSSGDMSYNIPLMDVGGYPLNIAYNAGSGMDAEASWVGLGWNLSVGQINRNVRGLPDDFKGDEMRYENWLKPNITVGADFQFTPATVGANINLTAGGAAIFNNYTGFSMKPSAGIGLDLGSNASVGFNVESGPDGLNISPNLSIHATTKKKGLRRNQLGLNFGTSWNSRRGLSHLTMGVSRKKVFSEGGKMKTDNQSVGSSIGFAEQLYTPSKRVGMQTEGFTVNGALGSEIFGGEGQGQVTGFGTIMSVKPSEINKVVRAFGYNNTDLAGEYDVLDFNREKDGVFSSSSTNLAVTNYTYDIYAVQGQGVSGTFRPFRNKVGYVFDTRVTDESVSGTFGFEVGTGNAAHAGSDVESTEVNSHSGVWKDNNYMLDFFKEGPNDNPQYEKVHYKNVGDLSADLEFNLFDQVGNYQAIRARQGGDKFNRYATNIFDIKTDAGGTLSVPGLPGAVVQREKRQMRNQAIQLLTKEDVEDGVGYGPLVGTSGQFPVGSKEHHTAEIQIVRNDGARYIYGLPAYSLKKQEVSFAVKAENAICATGLVTYEPTHLTPANFKYLPNDQYFNRITTPAYVHTHLLTSVLSTDYADRDGDGPTPDDFGSYTKFNYMSYREIDIDVHGAPTTDEVYRWRVPYQFESASYNEGLKTETDDDQGNYEYGEKEIYLVKTIETKTHVAVFSYSERKDAHGVIDENGEIDEDQNSYKLDKIDLYSVGEYDANNVANSTPIKTAHFEYSYSLCPGVPNNDGSPATGNELSNHGGKLTLKKVYFTYRNSKMGKYTGYKFNYGEYQLGTPGNYTHPDEYSNTGLVYADLNTDYFAPVSATPEQFEDAKQTGLNPKYNIKAYDSWGNYLPNNVVNCNNTDALSAPEFNFTEQDRNIQDVYASAWCMREISLPSGGEISVEYESDDYEYVQDRKAMRMFKVVGAGGATASSGDIDPNILSGELFSSQFSNAPKTHVYVQVDDDPTITAADYTQLIGKSPIYFRFLMNMTKQGGTEGNEDEGKFDYVTGYFSLDGVPTIINSGVDLDGNGTNNDRYIALPFELVDKGEAGSTLVNPIAKAGWQFGRKYLSKHVYSMLPNGVPENDIAANVEQLVSPQVINNLKQAIQGPNGTLENKNIARRFIKKKSWIRLLNGPGSKLGGGCRVKEIRMSDVWESMTTNTGYQTMRYGQKYSYNKRDGGDKTSSGVAAYEPIGNKENPFVQPLFTTRENLLAPDEENYMELPFGESFFPSPQVTYGRVSVENVQAGEAPTNAPNLKRLHKTGRVVTKFYTSKDFPTIVDQTELDGQEDRQDLLDNILKLNVRKHFTATQGYVIHLNDMNGKQKSQRVYAEGQTAAISGVDYNYRTHGAPGNPIADANPDQNKGRLNNNVQVLRPNGTLGNETIGVEVDVVHDFRENKSVTNVYGVNGNLATMIMSVVPIVIPLLLPDYSRSEDRFRSATTTKVIHTFGLLEETVAYDAGATVYTKNLAWDQSTGEVLVTETVDEFNDKYYTLNYPAHWVYEGMGQAARNIGLEGTMTNSGGPFLSMNIPSGYSNTLGGPLLAEDLLTPGDEIFVTDNNGDSEMLWVNFILGSLVGLMDENGAAYTTTNATELSFKVVRSGHRNLQSAGIMNVTLMENPLGSIGDPKSPSVLDYLESNNLGDWRIINAGAVDYSDDWEAGCECGVNTGESVQPVNPFRTNSKGVWRTKSSRTFLTGRNFEANVTPRNQGFFTSFSPMYKKPNGVADWIQDVTNWTFVAEVTDYSPYGFELENKDALNRHSGAQYGYNNVFPVAVGANTKYGEISFDGFEDYGPGFDSSCPYSSHFKFSDGVPDAAESHSGKYSMKVIPNSRVSMKKKLTCTNSAGGSTSGNGQNQ